MGDYREGFQEDWAAHHVRRMQERIAMALESTMAAVRRSALEDAQDLGREARLRIESGPTHGEAERTALAALERALDAVQAALNVYDICDDQLIQDAERWALEAADCLARVAR